MKKSATTNADNTASIQTASIKQTKSTNNKQTLIMKKNLFVFAMMALTFTASAQKVNQNAVKINPLSLILRTGNVAYERSIGSNKSVQVGAFYSGVKLGDLQYKGYGITPEVRFYFTKSEQLLNGAYVAPFARFQNFDIGSKGSDNKARFTAIGGGATLGWQKTWKEGFLLNLFAGPSYSQVNFRNKSQEDEFDIKGGIKGFGLRTGISLGYSF
jgi:hypothetical protein